MLVLPLMVLTLFLPSPVSYLLEDECDLLYGQGCICNMSLVLEDIESILQSPTGINFINSFMSDVTVRIVQYKCRAFQPLPRGLDVTLLTTPSRVGSLPNDSDRQSLSSEEFNKAIYEYTLVENANIVYALPGSDQRFTCVVGSKDFLRDIDSVSYEWNFNKKNNLSSSDDRVTIHRRNGDLTLTDLEPNDQGTYYCTISYRNDNSDDTVEQEYKHDLEVITVPLYSILSTVHYHTQNTECKEEILELIELYVPTLIHDIMCRLDNVGDAKTLCKVTAGNPVCQTVENLKQVSISVHIELVESPYYFPSLRSPNSECNPICQQKIYAKLVFLLERNMRKALKLPIFANATFIMSDLLPNHKKLKTKILIGCRAGYYFLDSYCAPCPPNHFSPEGSSTCLKCKLGYYQPNHGSKNCKPSFKGIQNLKIMNISSNWNWKSFAAVVVTFLLLIVICCFIQQIMFLFLPLRIAFKCLSIVFSLYKTALKFTWTLITKSIHFTFLNLMACFRLIYWRKRKRKTESPEKNKSKKYGLDATEDESQTLIPEDLDSLEKFNKNSKHNRRSRRGLNKFKMKAKKSNPKNRIQKLASLMKRPKKRDSIPKPEVRDSSSSRFSDSSNISHRSRNTDPFQRHEKFKPRNKHDTLPPELTKEVRRVYSLDTMNSYHTAISVPQKNLLKDALLMSVTEEDQSEEELDLNIDTRPDQLDFIHLHTKLRKK